MSKKSFAFFANEIARVFVCTILSDSRQKKGLESIDKFVFVPENSSEYLGFMHPKATPKSPVYACSLNTFALNFAAELPMPLKQSIHIFLRSHKIEISLSNSKKEIFPAFP